MKIFNYKPSLPWEYANDNYQVLCHILVNKYYVHLVKKKKKIFFFCKDQCYQV